MRQKKNASPLHHFLRVHRLKYVYTGVDGRAYLTIQLV
jgi:hypothetical protein